MALDRSGDRALEGLKRLLENGKFTPTKAQARIEEAWVLGTDSLRAFVKKFVVRDPGCFVTKEDFYAAYQDFCDAYEVAAVDKALVGRRLPTLIRTAGFRPKIGEQRAYGWRGIRLLDPYVRFNHAQDVQENAQFIIKGKERGDNSSNKDMAKFLDMQDTTSSEGLRKKEENSPDIPDILDTPTSENLQKPTVSDLQRRLWEAFGVLPFKPSQLSKHFTNEELARLTKIMDRMRERGELIIVPLEPGAYAFQLVAK